MKRKSYWRNIPMLVLVLFAANPALAALGQKNLKQLPGFGVEVELQGTETAQRMAGVLQSELQVQSELKFRKAGLRVLPTDTALHQPGGPVLSVFVLLLATDDNFLVYHIDLGLQELADLRRNSNLGNVTTWKTSYLGIVGMKRSPASAIRENLDSLLDEFLNDFLASNPKPTDHKNGEHR